MGKDSGLGVDACYATGKLSIWGQTAPPIYPLFLQKGHGYCLRVPFSARQTWVVMRNIVSASVTIFKASWPRLAS